MSFTADQVQQLVQAALRRFEQLSTSDEPPSEVLRQMAETIIRTTAGLGAVAWMPSDPARRSYQPVARSGHGATLAMDPEGRALGAVEAALRQAAEQGRVVAAAPEQAEFQGTELHRTTQFYVPIDAMGRQMGVLHVIGPAELDPTLYRQYVAFVQQGARAAGMYLARRQSQVLQEDAASGAEMLRMTHRLLELRSPEDVVHELANRARQVLEAQRVAVVGSWGRRGATAFSDAVQPNQRAVLVRAVQMLADEVRQRRVPMTFTRGQSLEEDDAELAPLLDQVWELGAAEALCLTPLRSGERIVGVMAAEYGTAATAGRRSATQQALSQQAGPIVDHAIGWKYRPLRRTSDAIAYVRRRPVHTTVKALAALGLAAAAVWGLLFVPVPVHVRADARLEPAHLTTLSMPYAARVDRVLVETGEAVKAAQPLLELDTTDLEYELSQVMTALEEERVRYEAARAQDKPAEAEAALLRMERMRIRRAALEDRIDRGLVRSMIDGVVLTERPEQMEGMTLSEGEVLVKVADLSRFDLVMEVREEDLALVERSLRAEQAVEVTFLSRPWPDQPQRARIEGVEALSPTSRPDERETQHVFRITVPIELEGLSPELVLANPTGRAKLEVEPGSVAYRYGRRVWRFIQMTVLF